MAVCPKLPLFRVSDEHKSVTAVANTITLSFAQDPLIKWLRPLVPPWTRNHPETYKWQYRRVQRAIEAGVVLQSIPPAKIDPLFPPKVSQSQDGKAKAIHTVIEKGVEVEEDAGAVVLLFPPPSGLRWSLGRIFLACKLRLLDIFYPVHEEGTNEQRLERLMNGHDEAISQIQKRYQVRDLWYLEVVAVHPCLQGRGLGKEVMNQVLNYVKNAPIVLECTSESNISFYERLGFKVVEETELADGGEGVKLWFMLRQRSSSID